MTTITDLGANWKVDAATSASNAAYVATQKTSAGKNSLDQNDYLKLLTAQIQYQDPFSPMDNTQMVGQMTAFSQLAGQTEANKTLQGIADSLSGSRLADAASWIGKSMLVKSNIAAPDRYGQYSGELTLPADSADVSVDLVDASGATVKTLSLGAQKAGDVPFYWDGTDETGAHVSAQALQVRVRGATPSQVATWASIAAIQSPASGAGASLITPLGSYSASDALRLS